LLKGKKILKVMTVKDTTAAHSSSVTVGIKTRIHLSLSRKYVN
jgi:hypothetical protein